MKKKPPLYSHLQTAVHWNCAFREWSQAAQTRHEHWKYPCTFSTNKAHYKLRQKDIQQKDKKFWLAIKLNTLNTFPLIFLLAWNVWGIQFLQSSCTSSTAHTVTQQEFSSKEALKQRCLSKSYTTCDCSLNQTNLLITRQKKMPCQNPSRSTQKQHRGCLYQY